MNHTSQQVKLFYQKVYVTSVNEKCDSLIVPCCPTFFIIYHSNGQRSKYKPKKKLTSIIEETLSEIEGVEKSAADESDGVATEVDRREDVVPFVNESDDAVLLNDKVVAATVVGVLPSLLVGKVVLTVVSKVVVAAAEPIVAAAVSLKWDELIVDVAVVSSFIAARLDDIAGVSETFVWAADGPV